MTTPKTWFITGASSGFGRALAEAVLQRGDNAVITARRKEALDEIAEPHGDRALAVALDVTDPQARQAALEQACTTYGRVDVLANIASTGAYGPLESFTSEQIRDLMELDFMAPAELCREALPRMRAQGSGHILNLTSIAGLVAFPGNGLYNAAKFALEGFSEALHHEVKQFGVHVTTIEPGAFRTGFAGSAAVRADKDIADYAELMKATDDYYASQNGRQVGDPAKAAQVILDVVDADEPPVRLLLGEDAYALWESAVESRNRDITPWRAKAEDTAHPDGEKNPVTAS